jgi:ADP-ribose pyrophosphatase YjhB (NUDIX family)
VVLLDPEGRILLMRARLPNAPSGPSVWFTIGGGVEPGESVLSAAAREIVEETGLTDAQLGPVVWFGESILHDEARQPRRFAQHYILARTRGGALTRDGWQAMEHQLVDELRWWTLEEIRRSGETIYPAGLADLLADLLAGRLPATPLVIQTLEGPVSPSPRVQ